MGTYQDEAVESTMEDAIMRGGGGGEWPQRTDDVDLRTWRNRGGG